MSQGICDVHIFALLSLDREINFSYMLTMHFGVKTLSNLPNLTLECLPACYSILLTDV